MLAEDDILSMRALRGRPIVVLSACETAMGAWLRRTVRYCVELLASRRSFCGRESLGGHRRLCDNAHGRILQSSVVG